MTPQFPFSAVVGQAEMKRALLLAAVDPAIGGVLIQGPRGTAKSTLARALAELLPHGRLVTLPLGSTEERVIGTLDLERVLANGEVAFAPGLLHAAHGGVLYVDEVNLLADHLVDVLLDVAASGTNYIERDGVSHSHPARFVLIGTMNPDEGELRPQLLDRFGFCVTLESEITPAERLEIVRQRLAFDADPEGFRRARAPMQAALSTRCAEARARLERIPLDPLAAERVATICHAARVEGVRADLVMLRAARAHAAWEERTTIAEADLEAVVELTLRHRRRHPPEPEPAPASHRPESTRPARQAPQQPTEGDRGALPPRPVPTGPLRDLREVLPKNG